MEFKFTCPRCTTKFRADIPETLSVVMCPSCGHEIPVVVDEIGSLGENVRQAAFRQGNWILWAAAAFALVWGGVVLLMVLASHKSAPVAVAPPPAPVAVAPVPPRPTIFTIPTTSPAPATTPAIASAAPPAPKPPPPPPVPIVPRKAGITDADIVAAIHKGIGFILTNMVNGEIDPKIEESNPPYRQGIDALAVYALLHCSQSTRDERVQMGSPGMRQMIEHLKRFSMNATEDVNAPITYGRSLRASALAIYNRQEDRETLANDLAYLLRAEDEGAYRYDDIFIRRSQAGSHRTPITSPPGVHEPMLMEWDNSNSQYGLIGVWNCAEAGLSVPNRYWHDVESHWLDCQTSQGTWDYKKTPNTSSAMTMAGITALSVCRDFMADERQTTAPLKIPPRSAALQKAIAWFETGDNSVRVEGQHGYSLYGLERAALASGMMFAGTHDIYRELAAEELKDQLENGAFRNSGGRDAIIETSFSLLFLARGRNPVILNKLRYDGNWANHQRDAANLARYASYAMERPVNWQIVTLTQPWSQWMEAPILYIAGDQAPTFGPADWDRLKNYVENGGLIFTHADNGSPAFNDFVEHELVRNLFPKYEMSVLRDNDDLYSLQFNIPIPHPQLRGVSNGSRWMLIHCSDDLASKWQASNPKQNQAAYEMGLNLVVYATGKAELHTKTDSPYIPPPNQGPGRTIPVARVQYTGNWDPEPAAWPRFTRYFWWDVGWTLQVDNVAARDLKFSDYPIAHLTGTSTERLSDDDVVALRNYVSDGGQLIIDCCGGQLSFDQSIKQFWLPVICPGCVPHVIPDDSPILTGKIHAAEDGASDLQHILLRPYAAQVTKPPNTHLLEIKLGKGRVVFSEIDITTGLLGSNTWGITGYSPGYASALLKNIVLDAATRPAP
jgi:hypothetical protein